MAEKITAYRTEDGRIHLTKEDAQQHEIEDKLYEILMHNCDEPTEAAKAIWKRRFEIYAMLQSVCESTMEESGK